MRKVICGRLFEKGYLKKVVCGRLCVLLIPTSIQPIDLSDAIKGHSILVEGSILYIISLNFAFW